MHRLHAPFKELEHPQILVFQEVLEARASLIAQLVKNLSAMQETSVQSLGWEYSPGEGKSYPLQYSCLENSMDLLVGSQRAGHN